MTKYMFKIDWSNIKSAVVYGLLTWAVIFILSVAQNIQNAGTIFGLDWKHIIDKGVVETIPAIVVVISLIKNFLTTDKGKFLGVVTVIPDKEK